MQASIAAKPAFDANIEVNKGSKLQVQSRIDK